MSVFRLTNRPIAMGGTVLILLVGLVAGWWYALRTPTASPGTVPGVPTPAGNLQGREANPPSAFADGVTTRLSASEAEKIKNGETVEIKLPDGGSLKVGSPKKEGPK